MTPKGQPGAERANVPPRAFIQTAKKAVIAASLHRQHQSQGTAEENCKQTTGSKQRRKQFRNARMKKTIPDRVALSPRSEMALFY
jgi:hypothetical protein